MLQCLLPDTFRNLSILVLTSVPLYFEPIQIIKKHLVYNSYIEENFEKIKKADPSWIILSHWDIDHILGLSELDSPQKQIYDNVHWIVPNLCQLKKNMSLSAARVFCYILTKNKVLAVDSGCDESIIPICEKQKIMLPLYVGKGKKNKSTLENNIGIVMEIKCLDNNKKNCCLFPGDCEYELIPEFWRNEKYDLLVASHHGSSKSLPCELDPGNEGWAILSVGKNSYGHPTQEHIDALLNRGFTVHSVYGWHEVNFGLDSKGLFYKRMI